jgi:tripartite-type tricarboxylate transporter receptor subunit TctC
MNLGLNMTSSLFRVASVAAVCAIGLALNSPAAAAYPERLIHIFVPVAPGGLADAMARAVAARLQAAWGQSVIVENKGGANFQLGTKAVTSAAPDGYTLLLGLDGPITINPSLYRNLPYDPFKDLVPISGIATADQALIAHPSLPVKDTRELVALARQKPGEITFSAFGIGSTTHLYMEMLQGMAGIKLQAVQYKGAAPMIADVVAGHVNMTAVSVGQSLPLYNDGKVKILGIATEARLPSLPDIPTIAEAVPGFEAKAWFGLFAPAGTPPEVVEKLNDEVQKMCAEPEFRAKVLDPYLMRPLAGSPTEFAAFLKSEAALWKKVITDADLQFD